jgi:hypothetical protein
MNQPLTVRTMSPAVRFILGGVLFVGAAIFILSIHRPPPSPLADIKTSSDNWWLRQHRRRQRVLPGEHANPFNHRRGRFQKSVLLAKPH